MRYILLIVLFASCYTPKNALQDVNKAHRKHPQVVARFCSNTFPCVTSRVDTLTETEVEYITLKCPDDNYILDTIWITNTKVVKGSAVIVNKNKTNTIIKTIRDSAEIVACELELIALNNKCNQLTQDNILLKNKISVKNKWITWFLIAFLCAIIGNILQLKK
jgi:hypothetical protein